MKSITAFLFTLLAIIASTDAAMNYHEGTYTGNGNDNNVVTIGFKPRYVAIQSGSQGSLFEFITMDSDTIEVGPHENLGSTAVTSTTVDVGLLDSINGDGINTSSQDYTIVCYG